MPASKNNESKLKTAGIRMALKLMPPDLLDAAPRHLEAFLLDRLQQVKPEGNEAGACFLIAPRDGTLSVMTVTLDEQNAVSRIVSETTINELFRSILDNIKEL